MIQTQQLQELAAGVVPTEWRYEIAFLNDRLGEYERLTKKVIDLGLPNSEVSSLLYALANRTRNLRELLDPKNFARLAVVLENGTWRRA